MRLRGVVLAAAMLLLSAPAGHAQIWLESPPPRVRVMAAGSRTIGTFHSATDTTLTIRAASGLLRFSSRDINQVERSAGRTPNLVIGFAGMLLGAVLGGLAGCAVNSDDYGAFCGGQDDTKVIAGAAAGGIAGGLAGALVFKRERWEIVEFPIRVDIER